MSAILGLASDDQIANTIQRHTPLFARPRREQLEQQLSSSTVSEDERSVRISEHERRERDFTRLQRQRLSIHDFEPLKLIGKGAFGEVRGPGGRAS